MEQNQIKLYLLTGFLGAGKTTFLKKLIEGLSGKKIGVIMNEFGSIGIDGMALQNRAIDLLEINNGSIFCSCLKGAFIEGLIAYSELPIDYLFVETSGMADPSNIREVLQNIVGKVKGKSYDYQGFVTIVDAVHFLDYIDVWTAIEKQILASDLLLVNKIDLVEGSVFAEIQERIYTLKPGIEMVKCSYCDIDFSFLQRKITGPHLIGPAESCNTTGSRPLALTLLAEGIYPADKLMDFLTSLTDRAFRIKGFFQVEEGWRQVDVVGRQIILKPADITAEQSQLVIISEQNQPMKETVLRNWKARFAERIVLA